MTDLEDHDTERESNRKWQNNKHLYRRKYEFRSQTAFRAYIHDLQHGKTLKELGWQPPQADKTETPFNWGKVTDWSKP